jgi:hypothetical protein
MPITAVIMNLCIFGAVAAGPVIGGLQAGAAEWRPLFWIVAGSGGLALLFSLLTFEDVEPQDPRAAWDWVAQGLAGLGCGAAFFGASELLTHSFLSLIVILPLVAGLAMIITLILYQYGYSRALMPVRQLCTTFPIAGIMIAMCAGAASVGAIALTESALQGHGSPVHTAMLFWPELGGAVITAVLLGALFRTRFVPLLALSGMALLAGGVAVLTGVASGPDGLVVVGSGLVGLGVGASVSPALFMSGFSLPSGQIQRVFALIELLRGVAAFLIAPILLHLAMTVAAQPTSGIPVGLWVCFGLAAGGGLLATYLLLLGGARLQRPDLERWSDGDQPAWDSPRLADRIRTDRTAPPQLAPQDG